MKVMVLSESDVRRLLDPEALLDALARAFEAMSCDKVSVPPRIAATVPGAGLLAAMPGYGHGIGLAVKMVSVFSENVQRGLPSHQALICVFDATTGSPIALMDGTFITALRTAGAAALSTRLLARQDARVLAILGAVSRVPLTCRCSPSSATSRRSASRLGTSRTRKRLRRRIRAHARSSRSRSRSAERM